MYRGKQVKSPIKACKEFCKECMNTQEGMKDIWQCPSPRCNVFPFRMGKTERGDYPSVPVLSAIRNQCLECVGSYEDIKNCTCNGNGKCNNLENYKCPLYEFRFGENLFTKKRGKSPEQMALVRERLT